MEHDTDLSQARETQARLEAAWSEAQAERADGGRFALCGFQYQLTLGVHALLEHWDSLDERTRESPSNLAQPLVESVSDIFSVGEQVLVTQVKRTLTESGLRGAFDELYDVYVLLSRLIPEDMDRLRLRVVGKFAGRRSPTSVLAGWRSRTQLTRRERRMVESFKQILEVQVDREPRQTVLERLSRLGFSDPPSVLDRWLGTLLQIGEDVSPRRAAEEIWRDLLAHSGPSSPHGKAFAQIVDLTQARVASAVTCIGADIQLDRTSTLEAVEAKLENHDIVVVVGQSGGGKSTLAVSRASDTEREQDWFLLSASEVEELNCRPRDHGVRLSELLVTARLRNAVFAIDELDECGNATRAAVANLIATAMQHDDYAQFVLILQPETLPRLRAAFQRLLVQGLEWGVVEVELPIPQLYSITTDHPWLLPLLENRERFGPAFNLKLIDALMLKHLDDAAPALATEVDLLDWYWDEHVNLGEPVSERGRALQEIAVAVAERFVRDLAHHQVSGIPSAVLLALETSRCAVNSQGRVRIAHRFVADCARMRRLIGEIGGANASSGILQYSSNPLWAQALRWAAMHVVVHKGLPAFELLLSSVCDTSTGSVASSLFIDGLFDVAEWAEFPPHALSASSTLPQILGRVIERLARRGLSNAAQRNLLTAMLPCAAISGELAEAWLPVAAIWMRPVEPQIELDQRVLLAERLSPCVATIVENLVFLRGDDSDTWLYSCLVWMLYLRRDGSAARLMRTLAGREVVPRNAMEEVLETTSPLRGTMRLLSAHPHGPEARVTSSFRHFMLSFQNGSPLCWVIALDRALGRELLLALTIAEREYSSEFSLGGDVIGQQRKLGLEDIGRFDLRRFDYRPFVLLLNTNARDAIEVLETLAQVSTQSWRRLRWDTDELEGPLGTDVPEVTLCVNGIDKRYHGGRRCLYWHRGDPWGPPALHCLLMCLENWLYSRPSRKELHQAIETVLDVSESVPLLGPLVSLAKADASLLTGPLLPFVQSLQMMIWLEYEHFDHVTDLTPPGNVRSEEEFLKLQLWNTLPHRRTNVPRLLLEFALGCDEDPLGNVAELWREQVGETPNADSKRFADALIYQFDRANWSVVRHQGYELRSIPPYPEADSERLKAAEQAKDYR